MKKFLNTLLLILIVSSLSSCLKDDAPNFSFTALRIVSADFPESFTLNETYPIRVRYQKPDICTSFGGFDVNREDTTERKIFAVGTKRTDQESCTETDTEEIATFNFIVKYTGTYVFRLWQGEDEDGEQQYLEIEVPVE